MNKKYCIGCGVELQCEDAFLDGYVNPISNNSDFVKICFTLLQESPDFFITISLPLWLSTCIHYAKVR